jgi:hypothetical protein
MTLTFERHDLETLVVLKFFPMNVPKMLSDLRSENSHTTVRAEKLSVESGAESVRMCVKLRHRDAVDEST